MKALKNITVFLILIVTISASAQKSLVKNGDFETGLEFWRGDVATISPFEKKSGKNSCVINQYVGAEWKGIDQVVIIPKNTFAIEFSLWIKSDAIEKGKEIYNAGIATLDIMTANETNIHYENIAQITGSSPWTLYNKQIVLPENAKKLRIMLALAQTNGSILFDNVKAIAITEDEYIKQQEEVAVSENKTVTPKVLQNGDFENELTNWRGVATIVTDESNTENKCVAINSTTNDWVGIDQVADIPEGTKTIRFSGRMKAQNIIQGKDLWNTGVWGVEFTKDGATKVGQDESIGMVTGTTNWTAFEKTLSIPEGAKMYRIMLAMGMCTGTLLVDDIKVEMLSE